MKKEYSLSQPALPENPLLPQSSDPPVVESIIFENTEKSHQIIAMHKTSLEPMIDKETKILENSKDRGNEEYIKVLKNALFEVASENEIVFSYLARML